jgi:hypothetical protein
MPLTDDEAALLRAKLDGSAALRAAPPAPIISPYEAFKQKVLGVAGAGAVGGVPGAALETAKDVYGSLDSGRQGVVKEGAKEIFTQPGPIQSAASDALPDGSMRRLSVTAQSALDKDMAYAPSLTRATEMNTPLADVSPAPTLNPAYGQIGRSLAGGGGGGAGPGDGLKARFDAAQQRELNAMRTGRELEGDLGEARIGQTIAMAGENQAFAQTQAEHAKKLELEANEAHAAMSSFMNDTKQMVDDVSTAKPDPGRYMRNKDNATKIMFGIGAIASGMLRGLQGGPNEFMKSLDHYINQDIEAQQQEIENKKSAISARQGMFSQLLAKTGDARLAADQYRRLMYESVKTDLAAKSDLYGVPAARATVDLVQNGLDQKIAGAETGIAKGAWQWSQQQAAAAAAARAAAEKHAWDRQMDVWKMGLEKDKLTIEAGKAGKEGGKEDAAAITETTKRLADDDIIKNKALIESLARKIDPKTGEVLGLGKLDQLRRAVAPPAGTDLTTTNPQAYVLNKAIGVSDEANISNQEFHQLKLLYQTKVTGSGGSDEQMKQIASAFSGAGTMAEKRHAIELAKADLERREGLAYANLNPDQKATLQTRLARENQSALPKSVEIKK